MSSQIDWAFDGLHRPAAYLTAAALPAGLATCLARSLGSRLLDGVAVGALSPMTAAASLASQYAVARAFGDELTDWHALVAQVAAIAPVYFASQGMLTQAVGITIGASTPVIGFTVLCILMKTHPHPRASEMFWRAVKVAAVSSGAVGWGAMGIVQGAVGAAAGHLFERFNWRISQAVLGDRQ